MLPKYNLRLTLGLCQGLCILLCAVAIFALEIGKHAPDTATGKTIAGLCVALLVSVFNTSLKMLIYWLAENETHDTATGRTRSLINKLR